MRNEICIAYMYCMVSGVNCAERSTRAIHIYIQSAVQRPVAMVIVINRQTRIVNRKAQLVRANHAPTDASVVTVVSVP